MRLEEIDRATEARVVARLEAELGDAKALPFLRSVATAAPHVSKMHQLATRTPTTWSSRFIRAGVPSPKYYLAHMRLIRVHAMLADGAHVMLGDVASVLEYSSPQALARHIHVFLGIHPTTWRLKTPHDAVLDGFIARAITPYAEALSWFDPYDDDWRSRQLWARQRYLERAS